MPQPSQAAGNELFRALIENSGEAIAVLDADGRVQLATQSSGRVLGYTLDERIGRSAFDRIHPDDVRDTRMAFAECLAHPGVPIAGAYRIWHKDQSWHHIEAVATNRLDDPAILGVVVNFRDVTDRKRTEEALRASEERLRRSEARYRSLIQGATYGIYRATLDGVLLDANPALATMLGYDSVEELMGVNMQKVFASPADHQRLVERGSGGGTSAEDFTWSRGDGNPIVVRLTTRVVELEYDGLCLEGIAEDITARRALEHQLRDAQKMEALGRLARSVAHDFNNVLAAILGCGDLIIARLKPTDPSYDDAQEIAKAAERGAALTKQLLTFSRQPLKDKQTVDVHALVREHEGMLRRLVGDGIAVSIHTPGKPPVVQGGPAHIEQVLTNLVVNARDAMPNGGKLDLTAEAIELDEREAAHYPALRSNRCVRLRVQDTGVGIAPELQPHVFEPFVTSKDPSKGTGLGLSIVYAIVKEAGGAISFATAPNQGTTFEVLLPLARLDADLGTSETLGKNR